MVKSRFLMDCWQIGRMYAIVMMSEIVGTDIHEMKCLHGSYLEFANNVIAYSHLFRILALQFVHW